MLILHTQAISQALSDPIEIDVLRKAVELIIDGDECQESKALKVSQIEEYKYQVDRLDNIISIQDSTIFINNSIISSKDLIILNKDDIIKIKEKKIKKYKRITIGSIALAVLFVFI